MSAGCSLPSRAVIVMASIDCASSRRLRSCASLMFGTTRPRGVAAANPKFTKWCTMISVSVHVELTVGLRRTAHIIALVMMSNGETLMPAKSGLAFRRLTNSMVRVASTSTKTLTCGAVKALLTMPAAMAFRTPLTGMRSSRSFGHAGVWMLRNTLACCACRMTSSRVISPASPVAVTAARSTSRSFASLRMGGLAITGPESVAGTELSRGAPAAAEGEAGASTRPRVRRDATCPLAP